MTRRIRAVGEAAVPDWVAREARRFQYPDFDTVGPAAQGGGGGGEVTIMLAAFDSTDISKAKADIVCTGTNDHVFIQDAIDALPFDGGLIRLAEGEYHPDWDQIKIPNSGQITIQGSGMGTIIDMNDTNPTTGTGPVFETVTGADSVIISDMQIWGPSNGTTTQTAIEFNTGDYNKIRNVLIDSFTGPAVINHSSDFIMEGCWVTNSEDIGVQLDGLRGGVIGCLVDADTVGVECTGNFSRVIGCEITSNVQGVTVLQADTAVIDGCVIAAGDQAVYIEQAFSVSVDGCYLSTGDEGVWITATGGGPANSNHRIIGNEIESVDQCVLVDAACEGVIIADNFMAPGSAAADHGMELNHAGIVRAVVTGNVVLQAGGSGILVNGLTGAIIADNQVFESALHGIAVTGNECVVAGNRVEASSQGTTNTSDNVNVAGNANLIHGNMLIPAAASPLTRYGLNIASGNDNAVYANFLGDSSVYGTADSVNSGTNTQTSPAAGAIGGQFAY